MRLIDADELETEVVWHYTEGYIEVVNASEIENAPTIEPKRGEWVIGENENDGWCKCSVCGYVNLTCEVYAIGSEAYNYCPNCGASMKGEQT